MPIKSLSTFEGYTVQLGPLAQSVEPWNLDRRVPGSSLGRGGGVVSLGKNTLSTLLKQLKSEMLRLCGAEVESRVSRIYK